MAQIIIALHILSRRAIEQSPPLTTIMITKLSSFTLLIAFVLPFTKAVDSPANLRGVVAALTDEIDSVALTNGESRYGTTGAPSCKTATKWCSTSLTALDSHMCCANLTCKVDDSVKAQGLGTFNGVCETQGPPHSKTAPGGGRNGAPCRGVGLDCSTNLNAPVTHTCCKSVSMNLTCTKDDSVISTTFDGKCKIASSSGDKCYDFYQKKIKCDDDNDSNQPDVTKCTNDPTFPTDANCHVICNYHHTLNAHICSQGSDEEED